MWDNVGAGAGALLCPLKTIEIGPFSSVAKKEVKSRSKLSSANVLHKCLPGFCLATAENAIGAVGSIVDGDRMLLLFELFWARIWAADGWWFLLGVELINGLELIEEFCEAATEAADVMLLLKVLELFCISTVDVWFGRELLISVFARKGVGFMTG